jgi:predicted dehydrogenase
MDIVDITTGKVATPNHPRTSPDHILLQGTLTSGAVTSISYYTAPSPTIDPIGIRWTITGTKGQIELVTPGGQWQIEAPEAKLRVKIGEEDVQEIELYGKIEEELTKVPLMAKNTARVYEAFVGSEDESKGKAPDFEEAVQTHKLLDWIRSEAGW